MSTFKPFSVQSTVLKLVAFAIFAGAPAGAFGQGGPGGGSYQGGQWGGGGFPTQAPSCQRTLAEARELCSAPGALTAYDGVMINCLNATQLCQQPGQNGGYSQCAAALDRFELAAGSLGRYCVAAAAQAERDSRAPAAGGSQQTQSNARSAREFGACLNKLRDCSSQEDALADEVESGGAGDLLGELSLGTSCNSMSAAQAEDMKSENKEYERDLESKQQEKIDLARKINDAAAEDDRKETEALNEHEQAQAQNRQKERELSDGWAQKRYNSDRAKAGLISRAIEGFRQMDRDFQNQTRAYLAARAGNRAQIRTARAACERRAAGLMAQLERERKDAITAYTNNTGSLKALTGSVERFKSRYFQDLNNCLATDYKRTVDEANDALALAEVAYRDAKASMEQARADVRRQIASDRESMDEQMKLEYQKLETDLAALDEGRKQEQTQYERKLTQIRTAAAQRRQTEQQEQIQLAQREEQLKSKIQLNVNRIAQLGIQNPGPATTKSAERRLTKAENGQEKLETYRAAYCRAKDTCEQEKKLGPRGADPGCGRRPSGGYTPGGSPAGTGR